MLQGARLTLDADVDQDGAAETGVFDLSKNIEITPRIRTGNLIAQAGSSAGSFIDVISGSEGGRAGFNLDAGGGAAAVDITFRNFEGSDGRWGNNSTNDQADAEGEHVFRQMSVLYRYLNIGTFDSRSPATLEWGEYSTNGVYEPMQVTFEEPSVTFNAEEAGSNSVYSGTITAVATRSLDSLVSQTLSTK